MQLLCPIFFFTLRKSIPCNNLSTALRDQNSQRDIRHVVESTLVRNSIINIYLPLMMFIRMHSQEYQFHSKCLICSIKFIIYVQIPPFVRAFGKQIQTRVRVQPKGKTKSPKSFVISRRNMSNEV
jgi:hypothetical protein